MAWSPGWPPSTAPQSVCPLHTLIFCLFRGLGATLLGPACCGLWLGAWDIRKRLGPPLDGHGCRSCLRPASCAETTCGRVAFPHGLPTCSISSAPCSCASVDVPACMRQGRLFGDMSHTPGDAETVATHGGESLRLLCPSACEGLALLPCSRNSCSGFNTSF